MNNKNTADKWVNKILSLSIFYRLFKAIIKSKNVQLKVVQSIKPKAGLKILDIGCGNGDILEHLPGVNYSGFDANGSYIKAAKTRYGSSADFKICDLVKYKLKPNEQYDVVLAAGILHHLNNKECEILLSLSLKALKRGGKLVTLDGVIVDDQPFLARFLLQLDRGKHVRRKEEHEKIAKPFFPKIHSTILNNLIRVPYTHLIMTCTKQ